MFRYLINLLLIISLIPKQIAIGFDVNGQLKNAQLEKSASDPVTNAIEGRFYFNTSTKKAKVHNGSTFVELGSGGGFGINYLQDWSNAGNWTCTGGDLTLSATTTASDLPREQTSGAGIKIIAGAGTQDTGDYCYYDFTLDDIDINRKLNLLFAQKQSGSYVADNFKAFIATQAARTTAIGSPIVSNVSAYDGEFNAYGFDTSSTQTLSLVIQAQTNMTASAGIVISDVIVGPGTIQAVPAVGNWETFTPTWTNLSVGNGTSTGRMWRNNGTLFLDVNILFGSTTSVSGNIGFTLPNSLNSVLPSTNFFKAGVVDAYDADNSANRKQGSAIMSGSTTSVIFSYAGSGGTTWNASTPFTWANGDAISFRGEIPIAEWAGAPNYAGSNDTTWGSDDGTNDVFGPNGSLVPSIADSTGTTDRVFTVPSTFQAGDLAIVEYKLGTGNWQTAVDLYPNSYGNNSNSNNAYGIAGFWSSTSNYTVRFGNRGNRVNATNADAASSTWATRNSAGDRFRVRLAKAGAAVGFGLADATRSGLVSNESSGNGTSITVGNWSGTANTVNNTAWSWYRVGKTVVLAINIQLNTTVNSWQWFSFNRPSGVPVPKTLAGNLSFSGSAGSGTGPTGLSTTGVGTIQFATSADVFYLTFTAANTASYIRATITYETN